jgi:hypothetical protein
MPGPIHLLRPFRALCLAGGVIAALQACGGRSDTEDYLYGDDVTDGATSATGGTPGTGASSAAGGKKPGKAGASGTGAVGTGASAAVGGDANEGGRVSTGGSGSGFGGAAPRAGASQGGFAQAGTGSGGTGPVNPVTCGTDVCNALTEVCCATLGGLGCVPEDQECGGATLLCGSSSDCTDNQVCCLQLIGEVDATAECKDACGQGMGAQRERRLCTTDAECSPNRPNCRDTTFGVKVCTRF